MAISDCSSASEVAVAQPCLNCYQNEIQLLALLAYLFGAENGQSFDDQLEDSAQYRNLSNLDFLKGLVSTLPDDWLSNVDWSNIDASIRKYENVGLQTVKGMLLQSWCEYFKSV